MNQLTEDRVREIVREEMKNESTVVTMDPVFSAAVRIDKIAKKIEEAFSKAMEVKKMGKTEYKDILRNLLDQMMGRLEQCEPELVPEYVAMIIDLVERIYALDRKLNA